MTHLPPLTSSLGGIVLVCPWCRQDMDDGVIRLADLVNAWEGEGPDWPERDETGQAVEGALVVDCLSCGRPSMVSLAGAALPSADTRFIKLVPVRTSTDARLVGMQGR